MPAERAPGKVQAIGVLHLLGGVLNLVSALFWMVYGAMITVGTLGLGFLACCPVFVLLPLGVVEVMSGVRHLSSDHDGLKPPRRVGIAQLFAVLGCMPTSVISGVLTLVFLSDPEVAAYYERKQSSCGSPGRPERR